MNIFQQVFANVGQPTENQANITSSESAQTLPKTKFQENNITATSCKTKVISNQNSTPNLTVNFDLSNVQMKPNQSIPNNNHQKKDKTHEKILLDRLESIQKKVLDIESKLKHEEQELENMKVKNEQLRNEKREKEIRIEKLNTAANETNKKIIEMQNEFDRKEDEINRHWEFKYMELRFQIHSLKEEQTV